MALKKTFTVLVVDDEEDIRNVMKNCLERRGYTVLTAGDGEEALKKMEGTIVDIVLCDIVMPKMNGIEFLQRMRQYNLKTEVIMITGQSTPERCVDSLEFGACQYLMKPTTVENILKSIDRAKRNIKEKQEILRRALKEQKPSPQSRPLLKSEDQ